MLLHFQQYAYFCFLIEMNMTRVNHENTLNKTLMSRTQSYSLSTIDAIGPQVLFVFKKTQIIIIIIWKFDRETMSTTSAYRKNIHLFAKSRQIFLLLFTFGQLMFRPTVLSISTMKDCCFFTVLWSAIILGSIWYP